MRPLSTRQRQVIECAALGMDRKQTAAHLGLAPPSINAYRAHALAKLDARSIAHAVAIAIRHALI